MTHGTLMITTRSALRTMSLFGLLGLVAVTGAAFAARRFWLADIVATLGWQIGWGALLLALLFLVAGSWRWALFTLALAAWHLWPDLSLYVGKDAVQEHGPVLTIASANLLLSNREHDAFIRWLDIEQPDLVALQEVSPLLLATLESRRPVYPHMLFVPPVDSWNEQTCATALLSKRPFEKVRTFPTGHAGVREIMEVVVSLGRRAVTIRSAHVSRPGPDGRTVARAAVLSKLGKREWGGAGILLGDLNVTSRSPAFRDLLKETGLRDSRRGFGRLPTWQRRTFGCALWFAIDHILVGEEIVVLDRRVAPLQGSDHLPVVARVAVRR